jgi:hypothetical protein
MLFVLKHVTAPTPGAGYITLHFGIRGWMLDENCPNLQVIQPMGDSGAGVAFRQYGTVVSMGLYA